MSKIIQMVHKNNNKNNLPVGFLAAIKNPHTNTVFVGYSLCRRGDVFNKHLGQEIALNRAISRATVKNTNLINIPQTMLGAYSNFVKRCSQYFKNCEIV